MKTPQITTTTGTFGIFNQILLKFGDLTLLEIPSKMSIMTVADWLSVLGPIVFYIWCILFDEEKFYTDKLNAIDLFKNKDNS